MPNPRLRTISDQIWWTYACLCGAHAALTNNFQKYSEVYETRMRQWKRKDMRDFEDEAAEKIKRNTCCYCGKEEATRDHLIPRNKVGRELGSDNLIQACKSCNSSKGDRDLLEWMEKCGDFPSILVLRQYLKLIRHYCESHGLMEMPLEGIPVDLPFNLSKLPTSYTNHWPVMSDLKLWAEE